MPSVLGRDRADEAEFVPTIVVVFEGFRWRTVPDLKLNCVWLYIYTEKPPGDRMQVWFDDVVLATEYIGPLAK